MQEHFRKTKDRYYKKIVWSMIIMSVLILSGCSNQEFQKVRQEAGGAAVIPLERTQEPEQMNYDAVLTGVVKNIDIITKMITVFDVDSKFDKEFFYTGGSDITDRYDTVIAMAQVAVGEIVDIYYDTEKEKVIKLHISDTAWEYKGVDKLKINKSHKIMELANQKYQYEDNLFLFSKGRQINLIDLNEQDELTVKGVGNKIYSILVTKGHGYIRLEEYDDFMDGLIEVGSAIMMPVKKNMLIAVREGTYNLTMKKGQLKGDKQIRVLSDKEIMVNMGEFKLPADRVGEIKFLIGPEGADLYIDGTKKDYKDNLELKYGDYEIKVSLAGYKDFTGMLTVEDAFQNIEIFLTPETPEEETETDAVIEIEEEEKEDLVTDSNTNTDTMNKDSNTNTDTEVKLDPEHTITIQSPVGVEVYVNGTYKGTTPVTFPKMIGNLTVTFGRDGYINQSYSVEVLDDEDNAYYMFPSLSKSNG